MYARSIQYRSTKAFTLLEVLVAVLVLSIGLLGLAALQADSLKNNSRAYLRSQANQLAYDMMDRMRSNMAGINFYDGIIATNPPNPGCITSGCSAEQMANYDAFEWSNLLESVLPSAQATITSTAIVGVASSQLFTITIMWDDDRTGATGTNCSGDTSVDLTCFTLSSRI